MPTTSSAAPADLARYARATRERAARLDAEARRLEAAVAAFTLRCTEFRVGQVDGLAGRLLFASRRLDELGRLVDEVSQAFARADAGKVGASGEPRSVSAHPAPAGHAPAEHIGIALATLAQYRSNLGVAAAMVGAHFVAAGWAQFGERAMALTVELTGVADVQRAFAALSAAMGQGMAVLGGVSARSGPDAAALLVFELLWLGKPVLPGGALVFEQGAQELAWNALAIELLLLLGGAEGALTVAGPFWPVVAPPLVATLGPPLAVTGLGAVALSVVGDAPHWTEQPIDSLDDSLDLVQRSFWNQSFQDAEPALLRLVAARVDALNLLLSRMLGGQEPTGPAACDLRALGGTVDAAYTAISYMTGEQVVLERLNDNGDYRISLTGLDPTKPGAFNNFEAVIITGYFPPEENHYYRQVRQRFFEALRSIPPGSELHLQGHSMGGGMALLLRDDPEVQRRLRELQITVPSLTIYGAVVPAGTEFTPLLPADSPFAGTVLRAFVNASDSLALNVGAGYAGYAEVQLLGGSAIDAPARAHTDYGNGAHYQGLPDDLRLLPYTVEPESYERSVPGLPLPPEPIEIPPILSGA